ncbi:MAG: molybdopterin synthase catalytic subunit MoaE [Proteobacteria bacterium]|nr:molybdopterin synthase catalytic subunit MoaE [Pseudomonadota bacterium]
MRCQVDIQESDFDIASLQAWLLSGSAGEGAIATFTGYVRVDKGSANFQCMELEHYPGMTQDSIGAIVNKAAERWPIITARVVHRVGRLYPGDQIVWVGVSSAHRGAAFSACEYIMDYLKAEAPLWKKEYSAEGECWVDAKESDSKRADRWAGDSTD